MIEVAKNNRVVQLVLDAPPVNLLDVSDPVVLDRSPGHLAVFARAAWRATHRPQGVLPDGTTFPALSTQLRGVRVSATDVAAYRAVCHLPGDDAILPLPMPEILFFGPLGILATDRRFPLSPFGLIHTGQTLEGERPLEVGRSFDLEAGLAEVRRTEKGYELDTRLTVADEDGVAWQAMTTVLSRVPSVRTETRRQRTPAPPEREEAVEFLVPGDTGRAYARVSGDWNPHHLWRATARPLGYRLPIAHGMWTLARIIGLLPSDVDTTVGHVAATFHRPILMPGIVAARVALDGNVWSLDAWSPERGTPHLRGTLRP